MAVRDLTDEGEGEDVRKKKWKWKWRGPMGEDWGEYIDPCRECEA